MSKCWLCYEEKPKLDMVCNCKNGLQFAHQNCIIKWIYASKEKKCRFCNTEYKIDNISNTKLNYYKFKEIVIKFYEIYKEFSDYCLENQLFM